MDHIIDEFRDFIGSQGMEPPPTIMADGKVHRFSANGKKSDAAGWYVLHLDGIPAGACGNWREGFTANWCSKKSGDMTAEERQAHRERVRQFQRQRDAEYRRP